MDDHLDSLHVRAASPPQCARVGRRPPDRRARPPKVDPLNMVTDDSKPFEFRVDSRLLILTGSPKEHEMPGVYYYRWTGSGLKQFHYVAKTLGTLNDAKAR